MLLGVFGMLFWLYETIQDNARAVLIKEQEQYQIYKHERDVDFANFEARTSIMIGANMRNVQESSDRILSIVDSKLNQQSNTIKEVGNQVAQAPKGVATHTIEHHTEVISDSELKRREKLKDQWAQYRKDKAEWQAKYGHKRKQ